MKRLCVCSVLIMSVLFFSVADAAVVNVSVDNPSFEYPAIEQGFASYRNTPGWSRKVYLAVLCPELRNPRDGFAVMPTDGSNYAWYEDGELFQIVGDVEANTVYTCEIDANKYVTSGSSYSFSLSIRDEIQPYYTEIAEADKATDATDPLGTGWQTVTLQFDSAAHPSWVGKPLMLYTTSNKIGVDNIRMTKTCDVVDVVTLSVAGPAIGENSIEPGIGSFDYKVGDEVLIRAHRYVDNGDVYVFDHWNGDVEFANQVETSIIMDANKTIEAVYVPAASAGSWDVKADTWVATDAQGRELPGFNECGGPRDGKFAATYYVLWFNSEGRMYHEPYDNTKLLEENPSDPAWGPELAFHYWAEPELGYYKSVDDYVMRKHIYALVNAGIDVLVLEATNVSTYPTAFLTLCEALRDVKEQGVEVPKICFWVVPSLIQELYDKFYKYDVHSDLWLYWDGKPLILPVAYLLNPTDPADQFSEFSSTLRNFFTMRSLWDHEHGDEEWSGGQFYPQDYGWDSPDYSKPEQVAVTVARHATTNTGRSFHNSSQPPYDPDYHLTGTQEKGYFFSEQFDRALELDPEFLLIAEWNEWCAMRFVGPDEYNTQFLGHAIQEGESFFVDQYNLEYSRDLEPMKGGYTDDYYYQLVEKLRRYNGVRPPEVASNSQTVAIDGAFDEWQNVMPDYKDHIDDTLHRRELGWGDHTVYTDTTGRNDIIRAKVARDDSYVYFYVQTRHAISPYTDSNWMMLFIDSDQNNATGWEGYDFAVNMDINSATSTTLKQATSGWNWTTVDSDLSYAVNGNQMEIRIPRSAIAQGSGAGDVQLDFHWADNIQNNDDIIEFAISGDSAPDRRFMYRYDSSETGDACAWMFSDGQGNNVDFDEDCDLDIDDLALFAQDWLSTYELDEFSALAQDWQDTYLPVSFPIDPIVDDGFETGDFSKYSWTTSGDANWLVHTYNYTGVYSAKSGDIADNQDTELSLTVNLAQDALLSFKFRVSSEANYDKFRFYLDSNEQCAYSGEGLAAPWRRLSYPLSAGSHTFKWEYRKDSSQSRYSDSVWIDEVRVSAP